VEGKLYPFWCALQQRRGPFLAPRFAFVLE